MGTLVGEFMFCIAYFIYRDILSRFNGLIVISLLKWNQCIIIEKQWIVDWPEL